MRCPEFAAVFCSLASLALAESGPPVAVVGATEARLTPPMVLQDAAVVQPERTDLPLGGSAVFAFNVSTAGQYVIQAIVDAPDYGANSFYLAIGASPQNESMIWDIEPTDGFAERTVSWRGNGDRHFSEEDPKIFTLAPGSHELFVVGREPARLRQLSVHPYRPPEAPPPTETLAYLRHQHAMARRDYERRRATWETFAAEQSRLFDAAVRWAENDPRSDQALEALEWVLLDPRSWYLPAGPVALQILAAHHATDPRVVPVLATLAHFLPNPSDAVYPAALELFFAARTGNPDRSARGHAALAFAHLAKRNFQWAEFEGDTAKLASSTRSAVEALETVQREFGDCVDARPHGQGSPTLGELATRELHEIRNLSIGRVAPEIEGEDLNEDYVRLSDYRGQVVLLVFWASWCGPCMADVPHEKALVEAFAGRPFVLLGVNGDNTRENGRKAVAKNQIPWRSFWNDEKGAGPSIAESWNVRGWPTLYVIDHHGVIRHRYLRGSDLDPFLEVLVREAEEGG